MKRIGIIGTGQIAQGHLRRWAEIDEIEVVVASDRSREVTAEEVRHASTTTAARL